MAALGHTTLTEAERYTREADRRRGGRHAVAKLEAHRKNGIAQSHDPQADRGLSSLFFKVLAAMAAYKPKARLGRPDHSGAQAWRCR